MKLTKFYSLVAIMLERIYRAGRLEAMAYSINYTNRKTDTPQKHFIQG